MTVAIRSRFLPLLLTRTFFNSCAGPNDHHLVVLG